jgi:hypothetical protein
LFNVRHISAYVEQWLFVDLVEYDEEQLLDTFKTFIEKMWERCTPNCALKIVAMCAKLLLTIIRPKFTTKLKRITHYLFLFGTLKILWESLNDSNH